ncbi:hypothetical protein GCM10010232_38710 [Streptomyces amakusaensis]
MQKLSEHSEAQSLLGPRPCGAQHLPAGGGGPLPEGFQYLGLTASHSAGDQRYLSVSMLFAGTKCPV